MHINSLKKQLFLFGIGTLILASCSKDSGDYNKQPISQTVNLSTYDYLKSKKGTFDSMLVVIDRMGLQSYLKDSAITVFALTNSSFRVAVQNLNTTRRAAEKPPLNLSNMDYIQLDTIITQYIINGKYPTEALEKQDGMLLKGVRYGYVMNAKLNANSTSGFVKGGAKTIDFSDTRWSKFQRNWVTTTTSSVNILTNNGVVHTLDPDHVAGFSDFVKRFILNFPPKNYIRLYNGKLTVSREPAGGTNGLEGSKFLIDESSATKYLVRDALATKPFWMNIEFATPQVCNAYAITSANDVPGRDPKNWTIEGSLDGITWIKLDDLINQTFPERFLQKVYQFKNTTAYKHYRFNITANNGQGNEVQLAEYMLGVK